MEVVVTGRLSTWTGRCNACLTADKVPTGLCKGEANGLADDNPEVEAEADLGRGVAGGITVLTRRIGLGENAAGTLGRFGEATAEGPA